MHMLLVYSVFENFGVFSNNKCISAIFDQKRRIYSYYVKLHNMDLLCKHSIFTRVRLKINALNSKIVSVSQPLPDFSH